MRGLFPTTIVTAMVSPTARPRARNALNGSLITALHAALTAADADDAVRAIVLTGADPAFCAGIDLKEAARDGEAYFRRFQDVDPISLVARLATPVVAAMNWRRFRPRLRRSESCWACVSLTLTPFR